MSKPWLAAGMAASSGDWARGGVSRGAVPTIDAETWAPRCAAERYRIYLLVGDDLQLIATTPDAGGIGVTIAQLDEDEQDAARMRGEPDGCLSDRGVIGINDGMERRWLVKPFPRRP